MVKRYEGVDFYDLDSLLSEEERMVRAVVRDFVERDVRPIIPRHYREGKFPRQLIPTIAGMDLLGATLSGYGCPGMNNVAYGLALQELERGDSGLRSFVSVQSALVMFPISTFGSDAQKQKFLPALRTAEKIGCFGLTEPDFGSNPSGMKSRAVRKGDRYLLRGVKRWITNGTLADVALIWARADDAADEVCGFLVEKGTPGFSAVEMEGKLSLRASDTAELFLEDVQVPAENRLPRTEGIKSALMCLNQARYGIAWGALGAAMACYDEAVDYAKGRVQFTRPIGGYQLVQAKLAHMLTEITKGQLLALQLGRLKDAGKAKHTHVSLAKRNNVAAALEIARMARDVLGANGIIDEYQSMRHMCNLESVYTYEGTHDIHTLVLGEAITGLPAYT
jgi:glutaryl-CoA dehydrogenase